MFSSSTPSLGRRQSLALAAALFLSTAALLLAFPGRSKSSARPSCLCQAGNNNKSKRKKGVKRVRFANDVINHWRVMENCCDRKDTDRKNGKRRRRKKMKKLDNSTSSPRVTDRFDLPTNASVQYDSLIMRDDVDWLGWCTS